MQNEKKYTIFDFDKLSMSSSQGRAKLRFGVFRNNPRVTVYTNEESDKNNNFGMITAALDPIVYGSLMQKLKDLLTSENGTKFRIENFTLGERDEKGKRHPVHTNDVMVGKDESGVYWISVIASDRPKFKFEFGNFPFHKFYKTDGTEMSKSELSEVALKASVKLLTNVYTTYITTDYEHTPPAQFNKGGNSGGGNKGGYNKGNYGNRPTEIENEDLPF